MKLAHFIALTVGFARISADAEDWGAYSLVPVSAPRMTLEAVNSGTAEGTPVSINKPVSTANQKWFIVPKTDNVFSIKPAHDSSLVLAASNGGTKSGTAVVLEKDGGKPWQLWTLTKHESGGYSLLPKHAPAMGLDDLGGKQDAGARIDLWTYNANDPHLQWFIKPLAGSGVTEVAKETDAKKYVPPAITPADIKPGTTKQFQFNQSKVFPGTVRDVTLFIPAQYDGSKPACVYVKTDGFNPREKTMMETMIATKEMPVTVGIFVRPGTLPAPKKP